MKKSSKKLEFNKKTIAVLNAPNMKNAKGGKTPDVTHPSVCSPGCY